MRYIDPLYCNFPVADLETFGASKPASFARVLGLWCGFLSQC